jgi:hypothetical protein
LSKLLDNAILVRLKIGVYSGNKVDQELSAEIQKQEGAMSNAGRWVKNTLADADEIKKLKANAQAARNLNYAQTLPWDSKGDRILPTKLFKDHTEEMQRYQEEQIDLKRQLKARYPEIIANAKVVLGNSFKNEDYPPVDELLEKFYFDINYHKIADPDSDFRIKLQEEDKESIRESMRDLHARTLKKAHRDLWGRCHEVVSTMAERLGKEERGGETKNKIFKDTLVSNVEDLCTLLDSLNITNDPDLAMIGQEIRHSIVGTNPGDLRKSEEVREEVKNHAERIQEEIEEKMAMLGQ